MEVQHGDVVFIPSAAITHSNSSLRLGETRSSIVQYTAGGNFSYLWKNAGHADYAENIAEGKSRWEECISMYGNRDSLEHARIYGKMKGMGMRERLREGCSLMLPGVAIDVYS